MSCQPTTASALAIAGRPAALAIGVSLLVVAAMALGCRVGESPFELFAVASSWIGSGAVTWSFVALAFSLRRSRRQPLLAAAIGAMAATLPGVVLLVLEQPGKSNLQDTAVVLWFLTSGWGAVPNRLLPIIVAVLGLRRRTAQAPHPE